MTEITELSSLRDFITNDNCCLIFDTNIYLNLYEYSPETTDFFVNLCGRVKNNLYLPSTVKREFDSNHQSSLSRQRNKFKNAVSNLNNPLNQMEAKLTRQFEILRSFNFPSIDELQEVINTDIATLKSTLNTYIEEHEEFEEINGRFLDNDIINELICELIETGRMLEAFTVEEIYQLCSDGEKRYRNKVPPGYKDDEKKKGVSAYGDFLIWKEALNFCLANRKNLIFVTDDIKEDWYKIENSRRIGFRDELIQEFKRITSYEVIGVTSNELFSELADIYGEEIPSPAEWVIGYDVENYLDAVSDSGIYTDIEEILLNSMEDYIDTSTLSYYDGSNFEYREDSFEITYVSGEFEGYVDGTARYLLKFSVKAKCDTNEYHGRDMDTREVILSPARFHDIEGDFDVHLTRNIDSYLDYWAEENLYDEIEIIDGLFIETSVVRSEDLCIECGTRQGIYLDYNNEPICERCMTNNEYGEVCTSCGRKIPIEFMFDGSTCMACSNEDD
ncbi:PIN-like domain-containing protein [Lysinibacillus boronitolerans]|uniref:PIN-like domain-containing protein n=1 Tax=Lysinibacillus boronitolerans TaxID=309788 RepID=UPI0038553BF9